MRTFNLISFLLISTFSIGPIAAWAANVPKQLIDSNAEACVQAKKVIEPALAKNPEKLMSLCTCSSEEYYVRLLPESEWRDQMNNLAAGLPLESDSPAVRKEKQEKASKHAALVQQRQQQAEALCRKKLGL